MKSNLRLAAVPLMLGLVACAAEYSKSEAPDTLRVDGAESVLRTDPLTSAYARPVVTL